MVTRSNDELYWFKAVALACGAVACLGLAYWAFRRAEFVATDSVGTLSKVSTWILAAIAYLCLLGIILAVSGVVAVWLFDKVANQEAAMAQAAPSLLGLFSALFIGMTGFVFPNDPLTRFVLAVSVAAVSFIGSHLAYRVGELAKQIAGWIVLLIPAVVLLLFIPSIPFDSLDLFGEDLNKFLLVSVVIILYIAALIVALLCRPRRKRAGN